MERVRVHLIIYGRVQGVFYRYGAQEAARELGLTGWVRNNYDGTVEAVAEGPKGVLERFVEWCWKGPPRARVDNIELKWEQATGEFKSFGIGYGD